MKPRPSRPNPRNSISESKKLIPIFSKIELIINGRRKHHPRSCFDFIHDKSAVLISIVFGRCWRDFKQKKSSRDPSLIK